MNSDFYGRTLAQAARLVRRRDLSGAEALLRPVVANDPGAVGGRALSLYTDASLNRALRAGDDVQELGDILTAALSSPGLTRASEGACLNRLGTIAYGRGQYREAIALYRTALATLAGGDEGLRPLRIRLGGNLAEALRSSDDPEAAHVEYLKATELLDDADDWYVQGALALGMAANDHDRRNDALAIRRALRARALFDRLGDPALSRLATLLLGYYHLSDGRPEQAMHTMYQALDVAATTGDPTLRFLARYNLAAVSFQREPHAEAQRLALAAYQEARTRGLLRFRALSAALLAELAQLTGDDKAATAWWLEAGELCEHLELTLRAGQIWQRLGFAYSEQGDVESSRRYMQRAVRCLRRSPSAEAIGKQIKRELR